MIEKNNIKKRGNYSLDLLFKRIAFNDDKKAFEELFHEFYPALCIFAQRYISSRESCEDIVQDTFYQIWTKRKEIVITSSFRNFLITSVKNNCIDTLRKQHIREKHANRFEWNESTETPYEIYSLSELEEIITNALNKLPDNIQKAFRFSRFEEMTYSQIAVEMGLSQKTIESYISKALEQLRESLHDYIPLISLFFPLLLTNS